MFDLTQEDLDGPDQINAVPEGETGEALDTSIDNSDEESNEGDENNSSDDEISDEENTSNGEEGETSGDDDDSDSDEDPDDEEDSESSSYQLLIEDLSSNGILEVPEGEEPEYTGEGLQNLLKANIEKAKTGAVSDYIDGLTPEAKVVVEALEAGASLEDVKNGNFDVPETDFSAVKMYDNLGDSMEDNMMLLVEDQMIELGYTLEEAEERSLELKNAGLLEKEAVRAKKWLVTNQEKGKASRDEKLSQMKSDKEAQELADEEGFKREVTETRDIAGFKLSQTDADELYAYMTERVGPKGETKYQIDDAKSGARLLYPFMAMKKFNKDYLSKEVKTKQAIKLQKRLSNSSNPNAKAKGTSMNGSKRGSVDSKKGGFDESIADKLGF